MLLDIGAVWCHWCHVMDGESYEDPALAGYLNDNFICIKVDRDERPDVDARYQRAVQAFTRQGGWPLTAFLTPTGEVFYGGTYFPPEGKYGQPGFRTVLASVLDAYRSRRGQVEAQAQAIRKVLDTHLDESAPGEPSPALLSEAQAPDRAGLRSGQRRVRQPAEVSPPRRGDLPAPPLARPARRRDPPHHRSNARRHGPGRDARPARRRIPSLQCGREVDRAALREDVVRQLRAAEGVSRRVRDVRHRGVRRRGAGHRALGPRGGLRPGGRLRGEPGRRRRAWTTTATTSPGRETRRRRSSRATSSTWPRPTTTSAPRARCTTIPARTCSSSRRRCRRWPGSPG